MTPAGRRLFETKFGVALWPVPTALTVGAVALVWLVSQASPSTASALTLLPEFGYDTATAILSAIATGMLAFTGLVAAVILLALQFSAGQLSPRLVATLVGRTSAKWALGISIAAFVYALLAITIIPGHSASSDVPELVVEVSIVLVLAAIGASIYLLHVTGRSLRVAAVASNVAHRGLREIDQVYPDPYTESRERPPLPAGEPQIVRWSGSFGVIAGLETASLVRECEREQIVIEMLRAVGDGVESGTPIMRVWGNGSTDVLFGMVAVSDERTFTQDPAFALRVLVDIALRALSPAVNDPTTATQVLHRIEVLLTTLAERDLRGGSITGPDGTLRVRLRSPSWDSMVDLALSEIRLAGAGQLQIARRQRALLDHLADVCPPDRQAAVQRHRLALDESVTAAFASEPDRLLALTPDAHGMGGT